MKRGSGWEARLVTWHYDYQKAGRALLWKQEPEAKVTPTGHLVYARKGPPDFVGFVADPSLRHGRGVVFDAKDTAKDVLYCSQLAPHQAVDLERASRHAFVFLCCRVGGRQIVLPWSSAKRDIEAGRKVFNLDAGHAFLFGDDGWLPVVLEVM